MCLVAFVIWLYVLCYVFSRICYLLLYLFVLHLVACLVGEVLAVRLERAGGLAGGEVHGVHGVAVGVPRHTLKL